MTTYRGERDGHGRRIAVVAARFNEVVTAKLVQGALAGLAEHGVSDEDVYVAWVPGAFEIAPVARRFGVGVLFSQLPRLGTLANLIAQYPPDCDEDSVRRAQ